MIVLPVILPEAHWADLERAALDQRDEAAARAGIRPLVGGPLHVHEVPIWPETHNSKVCDQGA